jgi:hypothetical protein
MKAFGDPEQCHPARRCRRSARAAESVRTFRGPAPTPRAEDDGHLTVSPHERMTVMLKLARRSRGTIARADLSAPRRRNLAVPQDIRPTRGAPPFALDEPPVMAQRSFRPSRRRARSVDTLRSRPPRELPARGRELSHRDGNRAHHVGRPPGPVPHRRLLVRVRARVSLDSLLGRAVGELVPSGQPPLVWAGYAADVLVRLDLRERLYPIEALRMLVHGQHHASVPPGRLEVVLRPPQERVDDPLAISIKV